MPWTILNIPGNRCWIHFREVPNAKLHALWGKLNTDSCKWEKSLYSGVNCPLGYKGDFYQLLAKFRGLWEITLDRSSAVIYIFMFCRTIWQTARWENNELFSLFFGCTIKVHQFGIKPKNSCWVGNTKQKLSWNAESIHQEERRTLTLLSILASLSPTCLLKLIHKGRRDIFIKTKVTVTFIMDVCYDYFVLT